MAQLISSGGGLAAYFPSPCPVVPPPTGFVACDGAVINSSTQPILASLYGKNLPDLRGVVIRGLDSGRGLDVGRQVLSFQKGQIESHGHAVSGFDYGTKKATSFNYGTKWAGNFDYGRKWTNTGGNHQHPSRSDSRGGDSGAKQQLMGTTWGGNGSVLTGLAGNHNHYVDIGSHGHSVLIGAHGHDVAIGYHGHTIKATGGNETRMVNVAMLYVVKNG